ncbi:hypothetical protein D9615_007720 [Tricholomella constricta]|uniref:BHLH domain-containing protein n=1 Tax=Tricholomella constricta TaxID=117010 RepID=A0A8H5H3I3_9AGAR|nr:hypothetical protein D9615_007720 [Tricholomella constricta]
MCRISQTASTNSQPSSIMAPTAPVNHDPTLSHNAGNTVPQQAPQQPPGMAQQLLPADLAGVQLNGLDPHQIMTLLRSLPNHPRSLNWATRDCVATRSAEHERFVLSHGEDERPRTSYHIFFFHPRPPEVSVADQHQQLTEQGNLKEDAAQTLSNLSQTPFQPGAPHPGTHPYPGQSHPGSGLPGINDPGPSSHPRGPPNLGQLSAVAMSASPASASAPRGQLPGQPQEMEEASEDDRRGMSQASGSAEIKPASSPGTTTTRRGGRSATMGSDEWSRQRKDNHKEVERRRRGNINEGINELGRIVPNGSGEKAKGAILSRAVQYIHHLKENEARNIEKWTLEKLLMDQAMGDLQTQLEEMKKMWEEERMAKMRAENELDVLRGALNQSQSQPGNIQQQQQQGQAVHARMESQSLKRDAETAGAGSEADQEGKKQKAE